MALTGKVSATKGTVPVPIDRIVGIEDSSRYWSTFMVLDPLRIVNEGIAQIVENVDRRPSIRARSSHSGCKTESSERV